MWSRPNLPSFDYVRPGQRDEVVELLHDQGDSARLMMGGTDLLVRMREGAIRPKVVVDVKHVPGMRELRYDLGSGCTIGAAATMNQVATDPSVTAHYPLLSEAARSVASYQVRNRATLGGNLCNASPCADTPPALLVLDAHLVLYGPGGERRLPVTEFLLGPGKTALVQGEFLVAIHLPEPPADHVGTYRKLGRNASGDLALVGVAVMGFTDEQQPSGYGFRVALGSVAPVAMRASQAEQWLASHAPGPETLGLAAERAVRAARPISDVRAAAAYQKAMVRTLALRGLADVWAQLGRRQP